MRRRTYVFSSPLAAPTWSYADYRSLHAQELRGLQLKQKLVVIGGGWGVSTTYTSWDLDLPAITNALLYSLFRLLVC